MTGSGVEGESLQLRYGSLVVRIEADVPSHLAWLDEFLSPQFERAVDIPPDRIVRIVSDSAHHTEMLRRGPDPGGADVATFVLDTGIVGLPRWRSADVGGLTLYDPAFRVFYTIGPGAAPVQILTAPGNGSVRNALMRVVRELALARVQRAGGLVLHAAAVAEGDRVVALAGPKGAGKTTLLIHLLRPGRARFVTNDRLVVSGAGPAAATLGLPTIVKVRRDESRVVPGRPRALSGDRLSPPPNPRRDAVLSAVSGARTRRVLEPEPGAALRASRGAGLTRRAAGCHRVSTDRGRRGRAHSPGAASGRGRAGAGDGPTGSGGLGCGGRPLARRRRRPPRRAAAARGVAGVPAFACELSATAYRDPASADALLALLTPAA